MPISREPIALALAQQRLAARDVGAGIGDELPRRRPRGAARSPGTRLDQLGVLDHHHRVGAARHHAAGGDGGRGAGLDLELRRMAAGDHLGVERELLRRAVGGAGRVGGAQREAVDIGAVERRHVDRRRHDRAPARGRAPPRARRVSPGSGARSRWRSKRFLRLLGGHDFEELLLPRRLAHGGEQFALGARSACGSLAHGHGLTTTRAPAGWPSLSAGIRIQPSACASACIDR